MNKTLVIILCTAVLAVSCQKNDSPATSDEGRIAFGVSGVGTSVSTRAYTENTASEIQTNGFNVAGITGTSVMFNELAEYASNVYSPQNGPYYFPASGTMNFYAVYPVSQSVTVTSGAATLSYTQNADIDLLAAKAETVAKTSSAVPLTFNHVLTLLKFKAQGKDTKVKYKLKSIKVTVPASGTYTYSTNAWSASSATGQLTYSSTLTDISTAATFTPATATSVSGAMTVIPCTPTVAVEWATYSNDSNETLIQDYSASKVLGEAVTIGKESTIILYLPNDEAEGISFDITVNPWGTETHELDFSGE